LNIDGEIKPPSILIFELRFNHSEQVHEQFVHVSYTYWKYYYYSYCYWKSESKFGCVGLDNSRVERSAGHTSCRSFPSELPCNTFGQIVHTSDALLGNSIFTSYALARVSVIDDDIILWVLSRTCAYNFVNIGHCRWHSAIGVL